VYRFAEHSKTMHFRLGVPKVNKSVCNLKKPLLNITSKQGYKFTNKMKKNIQFITCKKQK